MTAPLRTKPTAMAKLGRAVLQLRLFMRWTQTDLERSSGVDQTTISRLERGIQTGLSTGRLAAILDALRVSDVIFDHVPTVPQTPLELMIYGDHWKRAGAEADRRLGWPRAAAPAAEAVPDGEDDAPEAFAEDRGYDIDAIPDRTPSRANARMPARCRSRCPQSPKPP